MLTSFFAGLHGGGSRRQYTASLLLIHLRFDKMPDFGEKGGCCRICFPGASARFLLLVIECLNTLHDIINKACNICVSVRALDPQFSENNPRVIVDKKHSYPFVAFPD